MRATRCHEPSGKGHRLGNDRVKSHGLCHVQTVRRQYQRTARVAFQPDVGRGGLQHRYSSGVDGEPELLGNVRRVFVCQGSRQFGAQMLGLITCLPKRGDKDIAARFGLGGFIQQRHVPQPLHQGAITVL